MQPDLCDCPEESFEAWYIKYGCSDTYKQISKDLEPFDNIDMKENIKKVIQRYHHPESTSFCHYLIKANQVYRDCYGKHVGFNMFSDNTLLFLTRKVHLPDMEFIMNLGDWPLVDKDLEPLPVFSWCGNHETIDIVLPTYDLTESTLENMGRFVLHLCFSLII